MLIGAMLLVVAYGLSLAESRDGLLVGHDLLTVRLPKEMQLGELAVGPDIRAGQVLARFTSPQLEGEAADLRLKGQILQAERRIALGQPVLPDAQLETRLQESDIERRHLQASRDQLLPAHDLVEREAAQQSAENAQKLAQLDSDLNLARKDEDLATARQKLADLLLNDTEHKLSGGAASHEELEQRRTEARVAAEQSERAQIKVRDLSQQKKQLTEDQQHLQQVVQTQAASLASEIAGLNDRLKALPQEQGPLRRQLEADLSAAKDRRSATLQQIDLEFEQCGARLAALEKQFVVTAPIAGHLAYRDPAPSSAFGDQPLCVLSPSEGFSFEMRLPASEVASLRRAGEVTLELAEPLVERRFLGHLLRTRPLEHDSRHVLAELACDPPAEIVRDLADGKRVSATLHWQPPLYISPLSWAAALVFVISGLLWALQRRSHLANSPPTTTAPNRNGATAVGINAGGSAEPAAMGFASASATFRQLGMRLRENLLAGEADGQLLAAIEWALDRQPLRAASAIQAALGDEDLWEPCKIFFTTAVHHAPELRERYLRVLAAVAPEPTQSRARAALHRITTQSRPTARRAEVHE